MKKLLLKKIETLPSLPESIIELEEFRKKQNSNAEELIEIVKKDPLIVANLLKIANSSIYGFRSEVSTLQRAINLLGINFTITLSMGLILQNTIKANLSIYRCSNLDFINLCALSTKIIDLWQVDFENESLEELQLAAFLQETGKFVISSYILEENLQNEFENDLNSNSVEYCEEKYTGYTASKITAKIFKHWGFDKELIFPIEFSSHIEDCPNEYLKKAQILNILKLLLNPTKPFDKDNENKALKLADKYNLNKQKLEEAIFQVKKKIKLNS